MLTHADQATSRITTWWRKVRQYGDSFEFWNECRTSLFTAEVIAREYGDHPAAAVYLVAGTQADARRDLHTH